MEFEFSLFLFLFLPCLIIIFIFSKTCKPKMNLPPGPRKLPIIGNLHLLAGSNPTHRTLADLAKKYGPLMHLQLGEVGAIVVSSPETAKHFLKTYDIIFASRPSLLAPEINCYGSMDIAFAPYGAYWRQLRKICTLELFTAKRVRSFRRIREEEVLDVCKWIALHEGSKINLAERLEKANLGIMIRAALGKRCGEVGTVLVDVIKEAVDFLTVFNVADVYPSMKFLRYFSGMKRKIERHHRILDRITDGIIEERKQGDGNKGEDDGELDLLGVLLRLQGDPSLEIPLTTENIKSVLLDGAGVESSTTAFDWVFAELLKNPRVLKKAQDEVRSVFDGKNHVDEGCFDELNYLKLVIKETLRLHPPAPLLLPRESRERREINGYEIPAKSWVLVNAWAMGRDPKYWEDAETFKPERFLEKYVDFKASSLEYIPFGAGRRICPGISFGISIVEIELAMLLYHFDWTLPVGMKPNDVNLVELPGLSGRRKYGLGVVPFVRRPLPDY
ncbi:hypothetical protein ACS0TY_004885 [Phlomoides rotata]